MQGYGAAFSKIYNLRWGGFSQAAAPRLREFYESTPLGRENRKMLDLCCGAGHMAAHFIENGYHLTGIDLSEDMLCYARQNNQAAIEQGQAEFLQADAAHFQLDRRFGLVISLYDALNHLPDLRALKGAFNSVYQALEAGGTFIFDLNTRAGLRGWSNIAVDDSDDLVLITRGVFDDQQDRALVTISGFLRTSGGLYERFQETVYNTAFFMEDVRLALLEAGFEQVHAARLTDLAALVEDPENERRVFFVARK